jgi:hypothetical protein
MEQVKSRDDNNNNSFTNYYPRTGNRSNYCNNNLHCQQKVIMTRHPPRIKIVIKRSFLRYWDKTEFWIWNIIAYLVVAIVSLIMTIIVLLVTIGTHNNKQFNYENQNEMNESVHQKLSVI